MNSADDIVNIGAKSSPIRAVIFDLDGTLTAPLLNFDAIRAELGVAPGLPILEALDGFDDARRASAEAILRQREMEAIEAATLSEGCSEILMFLAARAIPAAVLTRNIRAAVERFSQRFGFRFAATFTREDGPPKPSPHGVKVLCERFGVRTDETLVVGDFDFDIIAGRDAGCRTALVRAEPVDSPADWGSPDLVVKSLHELRNLF